MSNTPAHGSDVQVTPDWWKASDGRFYPPELHPDYVKPVLPPPPAAPPVAAAPAAAAAAAPAPTGAPGASTSPSLSERLRANADRVGDEAELASTTIMSPSTPVAGGGADDLSLADRLRAEADRVGDAASAAADSSLPESSSDLLADSASSAGDLAGGSAGLLAGGAAGAAGAAGGLMDKAGDLAGGAGGAAGGLMDKAGDLAGGAGGAAGGLMDKAGDLAGGAGGAAGGLMDKAGDLAGDAGGGLGAAAAGAVGAAGAAAAGAIPGVGSPETDVRATMPAAPSPTTHETIIQQPPIPQVGAPPMPSAPVGPPPMPAAPAASAAPMAPPGMPPAPGAAPMAPPGMPPAPGAAPMAPPGMPPAPGSVPSAPANVIDGPGGITYTAAPDPVLGSQNVGAPDGLQGAPAAGYEQPASMAVKPQKKTSPVAGLGALLAGAAAIAGSLLQWGDGEVVGSDGVQKAVIDITGFSSSGLWAAVGGGVLIVCGLLFFSGMAKQLWWAIAAFLTGAVIVGAVVFSMLDIRDLPNRYKPEWSQQTLAADADIISMTPALGIWIALAGGIIGVLSAAMVNRS